MAQRKPKKSQSKSSLPPPLATVNLHAAGIDVGNSTTEVVLGRAAGEWRG